MHCYLGNQVIKHMRHISVTQKVWSVFPKPGRKIIPFRHRAYLMYFKVKQKCEDLPLLYEKKINFYKVMKLIDVPLIKELPNFVNWHLLEGK